MSRIDENRAQKVGEAIDAGHPRLEETGNQELKREAPERKRRSPEGRGGHPQRQNPQRRGRKAKTTATTGTDIRRSNQKQKTALKRKARRQNIGTGDTALYVFAGMLAAVVISVRVFLFKGAGKAN